MKGFHIYNIFMVIVHTLRVSVSA